MKNICFVPLSRMNLTCCWMEKNIRSRRPPSYLFAFLVLAIGFGCFSAARLFRVLNELDVLQGYDITRKGDSRDTCCSKETDLQREDDQRATSLSKSCFLYNSEAWLTGTRLSNADDDGLTKDHVQDLIEYASQPLQIKAMKKITSQTICHANSNFTNPTESRWSPDMVDEAYFRLIYMSIYHLFHAPALHEMRARRDCEQHEDAPHQIPIFDYECPTAKFFVAPYSKGSVGIGASFRNGIVSTILDAIAVGRIPIFLNNVQGNDIDVTLKKPSMLASCDRGDLQCMFMPVSPCTITLEEIEGKESKHFSVGNMIDAMADPVARNERVWVVTDKANLVYKENANPLAQLTRKNLYSTAVKLIDNMMDAPGAEKAPPDKWKTLHRAASSLLDQYDPATFAYHNDKQPLVHAGLVYFMRPKPAVQQKVDTVVEGLIPDYIGHDPHLMGVMIRGSDKCLFEATCLTKETYQEMVADLRLQTGIDNIILTSEDRNIIDGIVLNTSAHTGTNYIYNKDDASPGTGNAWDWKQKNITADNVMLSSLIVLKLQLRSSLVIGNCCSNFHNALFDLYREGCGMVEHGKLQCMHDLENPKYHTCCLYSNRPSCKQKGQIIRNKARIVRGLPPESETFPKEGNTDQGQIKPNRSKDDPTPPETTSVP